MYRVGGHSKGGNLALYATLKLPEEKQNVIRNIYVNDSPGICPEMLDLEKYNNIKNKIIKIVPEFCIVGRMFEIDAKEKVVISDANGLFQHNPFGWQVMGDSFVETDKINASDGNVTYVAKAYDLVVNGNKRSSANGLSR